MRRAIRVAPEVAVYRAFEGQICFELGRFDEARRHLERAVALDPESAHALYHLGLVLERLGQAPESRARAPAGERRSTPTTTRCRRRWTTRPSSASRREALGDLPRSIREYVEHVPVLIRDFPDEELIQGEHVSPQILGLFIGVPRTEAAVTGQARDVDRVILFKKNLEKVCRTHAELVEQIQITVKHEIGHYLGLDEDDLERLGLA